MKAASFMMIQDRAGFELAGDKHDAHLNTEAGIGGTFKLRSMPERMAAHGSMP